MKRGRSRGPILSVCIFLWCQKYPGVTGEAHQSFQLRVIKNSVADEEGAGMDGGRLGLLSLGGGSLSLQICDPATSQCCHTGVLNTLDDNWERGEANYFVGRQLGSCENHTISGDQARVTLQHSGSDGGRFKALTLFSSTKSKGMFECHQVSRRKLDNDDSLTVNCLKREQEHQEAMSCNGHSMFCSLRVDEFTFAGTHNAGTGQSSRRLPCFFKNQDLSIGEQLDLGIRFFDIDVVFSTTLPYCNGLETGHGHYPGLGLYQCFGKLEPLLGEVKEWMDANPREIIVLYFGEFTNEAESFSSLDQVLQKIFASFPNSVALSDTFKRFGSWPTLGEAVEQNKRIFVFSRSTLVDSDGNLEMVKELQVEEETPWRPREEAAVSILSTYNSGSVSADCSFVVGNARRACRASRGLADFIKLSAFGTPLRGGRLGTECLWDMARKCNRQVAAAVQACLEEENTDVVNFIQTDFPNYPGHGGLSLVELAHQLNLRRSSWRRRFRRLLHRRG